MVKTKGPALSTEALGKLGNAIIFSQTQNRSYIKTYRKPKQPRTQPQIAVRAMTTFLSKAWKTIPTASQQTWQQPADLLNIAPYHAYLSENQKRWYNFLGPTQAYPAAEIIAPIPPGPWTATALYLEVALHIRTRLPQGGWGHILYRAPPGAYVPSLNNVKIIVQMAIGTYTDFKDTPVPAGSYRYMRNHFSTDGTITPNTEYRNVTVI